MRSITKLFGAFAQLAESLASLASVVDIATAKLRMQLAHEVEVPALTSPTAEIVEHERTSAAETEPPASTRRSGKGKVS